MTLNHNIIILGAGFAGLQVAQELGKKSLPENYKIFLVDQNDFHLYTPDLYEVATAFNPGGLEKNKQALEKTIATPIAELIDETKIQFIQDEIVTIEGEKNNIRLKKKGVLPYFILVVALGSTANFFNIPGLQKHAFQLKTIEDALRINHYFEQYLKEKSQESTQPMIEISIGGGGATGVEVAAEIRGAMKKWCAQYGYPIEKVLIRLIEAGNELIGLGKKGTPILVKRLNRKGIEVYLGCPIVEVKKETLTITSALGKKQTLPSDVLIWTGGVQVNPLVAQSFGRPETRGAILVNEHLEMESNSNRQTSNKSIVFAAGDNAYFRDPNNPEQRIPMLAQMAYEQGKIIAENIERKLKNEPLIPYKPHTPLLVVPIGNRFGICKIRNRIFKGRVWVWVKRLISLKYALSILPFTKAIQKWRHGNRIFKKND